MKLLRGADVRVKLIDEIKETVKGMGEAPSLAIITVGDDEASKVYVRQKLKLAESLGIKTEHVHLSGNVNEKIIQLKIDYDFADFDSIIVQLPLPEHIEPAMIDIPISKDVDGFGVLSKAYTFTKDKPELDEVDKPYLPCTPSGIMKMLEYTEVDLVGKNAIVIGDSDIVGRPIAMMLLDKRCTVTLAHSKTKNLPELIGMADIVVSATGSPEIVKSRYVKPFAILIDVGITRDADGKLIGDCELCEHAEYQTPVPGGVGVMTVTMLMYNLVMKKKAIERFYE